MIDFICFMLMYVTAYMLTSTIRMVVQLHKFEVSGIMEPINEEDSVWFFVDIVFIIGMLTVYEHISGSLIAATATLSTVLNVWVFQYREDISCSVQEKTRSN
jgi:hypothetical protein